MTTEPGGSAPFWRRFEPDNPAHAAALATLRQGFGRQPGDIPGMWPYYTHLSVGGKNSRRLNAEHLALSMFGLHQQGVRTKVHTNRRDSANATFATALNKLRSSGRFSEAALDSRVSQAVTAPDVIEFAHHLRGLVTMIKALPNSAIDYDQLFDDLVAWQNPAAAPRVRLNWGIDYTRKPDDHQSDAQEKK